MTPTQIKAIANAAARQRGSDPATLPASMMGDLVDRAEFWVSVIRAAGFRIQQQ